MSTAVTHQTRPIASSAEEARPHETSSWPTTLLAALAATLTVALVLLAFAWPVFTTEPKDTPIGVVATAQQRPMLEQRLNAAGVFEPRSYADRAAAVEAIQRREIYGAVVMPTMPTEPGEMLTASAASPAVTQALGTVAAQAPAGSIKVTDVVALSPQDARGAGLAVAGLPLAMGGMIGGVLISMLVAGWQRRLAAVTAYGILGGLVLTLILQTWFGFVQGSFAMMWLVVGTSIAATAAFISGAQALIGRAGLALGAVVTMFIGNPISSIQMPKEWLPGPWGDIGQFFVPGAAGTLMRQVSYFPDAPALQPWLVLIGWLAVGALLTVAGRHKDDEVAHLVAPTAPDPA